MISIDNNEIVYMEKHISSEGVLLVHGITSSKDEGGFYIELSELLNNHNYSTFRFDFRGHGESAISSDQITISGMISDLFVTINHMERKYEKYSIVAASFGASIFLLLIDKLICSNKLKSVVFLNPVTNYSNTFFPEYSSWASSFFPKGGITGLLNYHKEIIIGKSFILNPIMGVEFYYFKPEKIKWPDSIPLLILHGKKDSIVSINDSIIYKNNQSSEVRLIEYEYASHGLDENKVEVFKTILNFLISG